MNSFVATFDVGTTSLKAALMTRDGLLLHPQTVSFDTHSNDAGAVEQDPDQWYRLFTGVARAWWSCGVDPACVQMIAMTGQMQNLITLDRQGAPVGRAILYSDVRASKEADAVNLRFGKAALRASVGNPVTAGSLLPKLMFLREHEPERLAKTHRVLFGAKDYLINRLCGRPVCDWTTASTTGLLLARERIWHDAQLHDFGFSGALMPELSAADAIVGSVHEEAALATGFRSGTPVLCGIGDAAATALGAGVTGAHRPYVYIGTTGWVAQLVDASEWRRPVADTVFTLWSWAPDALIRIAPVLNAGNVLAWALTLVGHRPGEDPERYFDLLEMEANRCHGQDRSRNEATNEATSEKTRDLTFVPFIFPERCPVSTHSAHGAFIGISSKTTRSHMLRAVCEGLAQSLRWCGDLLDVSPGGEITALGGATRNTLFMQAMADAFGKTLHVKPNADLLAAAGAGRLAARVLGWNDVAMEPGERAQAGYPDRIVAPDPERAAFLRRRFKHFQRIATGVMSLSAEDALE
jgi:xylulokinase